MLTASLVLGLSSGASCVVIHVDCIFEVCFRAWLGYTGINTDLTSSTEHVRRAGVHPWRHDFLLDLGFEACLPEGGANAVAEGIVAGGHARSCSAYHRVVAEWVLLLFACDADFREVQREAEAEAKEGGEFSMGEVGLEVAVGQRA